MNSSGSIPIGVPPAGYFQDGCSTSRAVRNDVRLLDPKQTVIPGGEPGDAGLLLVRTMYCEMLLTFLGYADCCADRTVVAAVQMLEYRSAGWVLPQFGGIIWKIGRDNILARDPELHDIIETA